MNQIQQRVRFVLFLLCLLSVSSESCNKTSSGRTVTVTSFSPTQGNAGIQVTIRGSGFSSSPGNDSVLVDGTLASIVSASSSSIVFTMPANPSSIDSALITVLVQGAIVPAGWFHYTSAPDTTTPTPGSVSTFAGSGSPGSADGIGMAASFNTPESGVFDNQGNLYVADFGNNEIRKITATGVVSTFAGSTSGGFADGNGTSARFLAPAGIAIDNHGNLYVADQANCAIRKIDASGNVTTIAGNGTIGYADGTGSGAIFNGPIGIGVDTLGGNLYVADTYNNVIRKIVISTGVVTTIAGSQTSGSTDATVTTNPAAASFNSPRGLCVRTVGAPNAYNLYIFIADYSNNKIREIITNTNPATVVYTLAGNSSNSPGFTNGAPGSFNSPNGTATGFAKNGTAEFFIADASNHVIRYAQADPTTVIAYDLPVSTLAGTGIPGLVNGSYLVAEFDDPDGVAFNPSDGNLYVMDFNNNAIRKIVLQ
jgi:DNA-binding beta-propeller fold protein YncE